MDHLDAGATASSVRTAKAVVPVRPTLHAPRSVVVTRCVGALSQGFLSFIEVMLFLVISRSGDYDNAHGSRSDSGRSESFTSGFICGGLIFGALGFIFAPQAGYLGEDVKDLIVTAVSNERTWGPLAPHGGLIRCKEGIHDMILSPPR